MTMIPCDWIAKIQVLDCVASNNDESSACLRAVNDSEVIYEVSILIPSLALGDCGGAVLLPSLALVKRGGGGGSDVVVSALDFRSDSQWFEALSLPLPCFLSQETLLHIVCLHPAV